MAHKFEQSDSGNDLLRARFTLWLSTALIRARGRYLETHTEKLDIVPLDEVLTNHDSGYDRLFYQRRAQQNRLRL